MNPARTAATWNTWRDLPAAQQPEYPDAGALR
ncbi:MULTISPECIES: 3-deoxy-7-phosphoheptulonate synthase, partial [unclassified Streptomyces]